MTFDLEWAKDPESGGITGSYEAHVMTMRAGGGVAMSMAVRNEGPGYYHMNNRDWWWLLEVMESFEMFAEPPCRRCIPFHKVNSNDGAHVTPKEIAAALEAYRNAEWMADLSFSAEDDPEFCCECWRDWIAWLEASVGHGGFRVW